MTSTQGHFGKEAKRNELAFLLSNDNKIKCFTADRKTVFILLSVVLVGVSNSELLLEYCHIIFQWLGFIRMEQFFTLELEIEIRSFVLFTRGVRISLRQCLLRRKKLQGGRVRTFSLPCIFITLVTSKKFCPEKENSWTKSCDSNYTNL